MLCELSIARIPPARQGPAAAPADGGVKRVGSDGGQAAVAGSSGAAWNSAADAEGGGGGGLGDGGGEGEFLGSLDSDALLDADQAPSAVSPPAAAAAAYECCG